MRIEARVGVARYADDNEGPPRIGNQGEQIVAELNPKYYEQTMRGNAFMYSAASAGAVLNVLSTTSAPLVWNPAGSGKNLIITKITVGLDATGTTAAGHIVYGTQSNLGSQIGTGAPVVSGTFVFGVNLLIGLRPTKAISDRQPMRFWARFPSMPRHGRMRRLTCVNPLMRFRSNRIRLRSSAWRWHSTCRTSIRKR